MATTPKIRVVTYDPATQDSVTTAFKNWDEVIKFAQAQKNVKKPDGK